MASLTIRNLDEPVKSRLRIQAARNGRSMEEEARAILRAAVQGNGQPLPGLGSAIRKHVAALGGIELDIPRRQAVRRPPKLAR